MEKNRATFKFKKLNLRFRHIYALIMIAVTGFFAWHAFDLLVLTPRAMTGNAPLGHRMSDIEYMESFWLREVEEFGATVESVDYVEVIWGGGPVIYVVVHVLDHAPLSYGRWAADVILRYFIDITNGIATQYNLQVVLFRGELAEILEENQAALVRHVHEYQAGFAERTLAHAEIYPNQANFDRAYGNINRVLRASIIEVMGESGLRALQARLDAIEIFTVNPYAEPATGGAQYDEYNEDEDDEDIEEVYMPWYPYTLQIEQSRISDFPNWGAWSNERNRIIWSP